MVIARNTTEFTNYIDNFSSRGLVSLECPQCNKLFSRVKHDIQSKFGKSNNREMIYCSRACLFKSREYKVIVNCLQCGIQFEKYPNQIKKSPNHFCTTNCSGKYNASHKITGIRRSKLEIWIEEKLKNLFPNLVISYNDIKTLGLELDIYIPSLQLAFDINGIFHYKPIYGVKKFNSIQINDQNKLQYCINKGIKLVIIDVSLQKKFTIQNSEKYLSIIKDIIQNKPI